jgi:hypothetical protein
MREYMHVLSDIWKTNKAEFLVWLIVLVVVPICGPVWLHERIDLWLTGNFPKIAQMKLFHIGPADLLVGVFSYLVIDTLILMIMTRTNKLHLLVGWRCKGKAAIKQSIKNITHHLLDRASANNLYGNLLLSKLVGVHQPKDFEELGDSFRFIRHAQDFRCQQQDTSYSLHQQLLDKQIDDFYTIQNCIRKAWCTVTYGDIAVLLEKPGYIAQNVKIAKRYLKRIKVRRLFVYPYCSSNVSDLINNELKGITLDATKKGEIVRNGVDDLPSTDCHAIQSAFVNISGDAARALRDAVYMMWLVKVHEHFRIDYRVIPRHLTINAEGIDIIGNCLLSNWVDEGSALIDNNVIVRFEDNMMTDDVIYYEFTRAPRARIEDYKGVFEHIFGPLCLPIRYTFQKRNRFSTDLKVFLDIFFNSTTVQTLLSLSADDWIDAITREIKARPK